MIHQSHEPSKLLQTLEGDLPICSIDPGPRTYPSKLKHAHNDYKNVEHNSSQHKQIAWIKETLLLQIKHPRGLVKINQINQNLGV